MSPADPPKACSASNNTIEAIDLARHAEKAGAVQAEFQPQEDVRVFLDPAGHPFCLTDAANW